MRRVLFVSLWVVVAGCVTSRVQRVDPDVRPAHPPDSVVVLEGALDQPYAVIARIESRTNAVFESFDDLRAELIGQAALLGGQAVIVGPETWESELIILATGTVSSEKKKLAGEVIVFR